VFSRGWPQAVVSDDPRGGGGGTSLPCTLTEPYLHVLPQVGFIANAHAPITMRSCLHASGILGEGGAEGGLDFLGRIEHMEQDWARLGEAVLARLRRDGLLPRSTGGAPSWPRFDSHLFMHGVYDARAHASTNAASHNPARESMQALLRSPANGQTTSPERLSLCRIFLPDYVWCVRAQACARSARAHGCARVRPMLCMRMCAHGCVRTHMTLHKGREWRISRGRGMAGKGGCHMSSASGGGRDATALHVLACVAPPCAQFWLSAPCRLCCSDRFTQCHVPVQLVTRPRDLKNNARRPEPRATVDPTHYRLALAGSTEREWREISGERERENKWREPEASESN
jgi:hypothetical protein